MKHLLKMKKKNLDGSYSNSPYFFNAVDLYNGDTVKSILEISPIHGSVKNVMLSLVCNKDKVDYPFMPKDKDSYELVTERYKGLTLWFADKNGIKYRPDINGKVYITNDLSVPIDIQVWLKADKYTVNQLDKMIALNDITIIGSYQLDEQD